MNLANKLTVGRLIAIPAIMICMGMYDKKWAAWCSFLLFAAACITDFLDGKIARSRNMVTVLGQFLDPLADKALVCAVLCYFIKDGFASPAAVTIVLIREFVVSGIRMTAVSDGKVIAANIFGKIKTAFQMVSLNVILLLNAIVPDVSWLSTLSGVCVWIIAALTAASGIIYVADNKDVFSR